MLEALKESPRAHFALLFRLCGYMRGVEVGVADGRYSEHFIRSAALHMLSQLEKSGQDLERSRAQKALWKMVELEPSNALRKRL